LLFTFNVFLSFFAATIGAATGAGEAAGASSAVRSIDVVESSRLIVVAGIEATDEIEVVDFVFPFSGAAPGLRCENASVGWLVSLYPK